MTDVIYLSGVERSGTNYIQWLLKENFKNIIVLSIYKHYPPKDIISKLDWGNIKKDELSNELFLEIDKFARDAAIIEHNPPGTFALPPLAFVSKEITPPKLGKISSDVYLAVKNSILNNSLKFLINIKNPYGWHISYTKRWARCKFPDSMSHWQDVYSNWDIFNNKYPNISMFVKHEDMLKDYSNVLLKISNKFNLTPYNETFKNMGERLDSITRPMNIKYQEKNYFKNELYIDNLLENNMSDLEKCRKDLDEKLLNKYGYKLL